MFPGIKIYIYPNCFLSYLINYTISYFYVYYPSYMDWLRLIGLGTQILPKYNLHHFCVLIIQYGIPAGITTFNP